MEQASTQTSRALLVDVIVPTRNRPPDLARMLGSLIGQCHANFRCVIVDQSDDPGVNAAVIRDLDDSRIEHVVDPRRGKSLALNLALQKTLAPLVALTDDDCTFEPDWLEHVVRSVSALDRPGIVFGDVRAIPHDPDELFVPAISFEREASLAPRPLRSPGLIGMGANMAMSRRLLHEIGGFDEDLGPGGVLRTGEDCEIAYRALRHGAIVRQDPAMQVLHWGARSVDGNVARDLVTTGFFAIGAGYGKHMRSGDWRASVVALDEFATAVMMVVRALVRRERPLHVRRAMRFLSGIAAGFRRGPAYPKTLS